MNTEEILKADRDRYSDSVNHLQELIETLIPSEDVQETIMEAVSQVCAAFIVGAANAMTVDAQSGIIPTVLNMED